MKDINPNDLKIRCDAVLNGLGTGPSRVPGVVAMATDRREPAPIHADNSQLAGMRIFEREVPDCRLLPVGQSLQSAFHGIEITDRCAV